MRTRARAMLGCEYPIVAFSHCRDVVAAVTNAGGCGVLGAALQTPDELDRDLAWIDERVGNRPYGVDLLFPAVSGDLSARRRPGQPLEQLIPDAQRRFVDDLLDRYGVPPLPERTGPAPPVRALGFLDDLDALFAVAFELHRVRLVASALGPPPPGLVNQAHDHGALVTALAGKTVHAERHRAAGVDLVVAQGTEAGGHTGEIATMVLVPQVVDAVAPTPVLAAGGIATGRQLAAGLALGAQGVWCGSVWLTTAEAETHPVVKEKFLAASSSDTIRSKSLTGKPARMLRTAWTDEWEAADAPPTVGLPLQGLLVAEAQARISRGAHRPGSGANELVNYFVGQVVGQLDQVKTCRQVVLDMVTEYLEVAEGFARELAEGDQPSG